MRVTVAFLIVLLLSIVPTGGAALAQEGPEAGSSALPTTEPGAVSPAPEAEAGLVFEDPGWRRITPASGPDAREDHTWTVDGDGRFAYLFGGRDGQRAFGDLWRYDLREDAWQALAPSGKAPDPRSGHSAVWVDDVGLIVFAGQRGTDFFGDLWAYDPETDSWRELPADGAAPKRRYGSCMVVGRDGRIWISHGFTFSGRFDDTRAYNLNTERWASIAPDGRRPGERCLHDCWTSVSGELVLYGGQNDDERALGDLWVTRNDGRWKRQEDPRPKARRLYAVTEAGTHAYLFGGADKADDPLDELWRVDRGSHEFEQVRVTGSGPSARYAATLVSDLDGGRLLLFGGRGDSARADLWELVDRAGEPEPASEAEA